jgi:septal ring factor EnvC (AmiA/AmiB activator)
MDGHAPEHPFPEVDHATRLIARLEGLSHVAAQAAESFTDQKKELQEQARKIVTQQREIQALRDQLNLFKLARKFNKTDTPNDLKARIDLLIETIDRCLIQLAD